MSYEEKKRFKDWNEFDSFLSTLMKNNAWEKLEEFNAQEITLGFVKYYFNRKNSSEIWELVEPDPPFSGSWKRVV